MKLKLFLLAFITCLLQANEITLEWLESKPRTYARDFYILQYLKKESITPDQAQTALGLVNRMNNKLLFAYVNRLKHDESNAVVQCMRMSAQELYGSYVDCIMVGLSIKKALQLDSIQLEQIIEKVVSDYPKYAKVLKLINSPIVFSKLVASDVDTFYEVYLNSPKSFRINKLNYKLSQRAINKIKDDKRFSRLIRYVITNKQMNLAQKSFFTVDDSNLDANTSFLLAMNLITHNQEESAIKYLDNAYEKAYFQSNKDKVNFWKYLITKDKTHLKKLLQSWDINIYTLYAKDILNKKNKNIIYDIKQKKKKTNYSIEDQFAWIDVIRDIKEPLTLEKIQHYENVFTTEYTKAHMTFLYSKYNRFKKHYFINPYKELIKQYPKNRQVLINAIARQESQFIPSSISTAYAQGVMQIMPFLSKSIANNLKEPYSIYNMFKPEFSIRYANAHLTALEKQFKHPLFIAYAYNGGGGFTKRLFRDGFFDNGKYEPYLSIEKIPYNETKEYGKKVLTNYIIYHERIAKKRVSITTLLEKLQKPSTLVSK